MLQKNSNKDDIGIDGIQDEHEDDSAESEEDEEVGQGEDDPEESGGEGVVVSRGDAEEADEEEGTGEGDGEGEEAGGEEEGGAEGEEEDDGGKTKIFDVQATVPAKTRPRKAPPTARRRLHAEEEKPRSRKKLYAIILVIIILVPLIGVIYFFYGPPLGIKNIDLIAQQYTRPSGSGLSLLAILDAGKPSQLSGNADLEIDFGGANVYRGTVGVQDSKANTELPLNRFAEGNGDYLIKFTFQGFTATTTFGISNIIEKIEVNAYNITTKVNATLVQPGTARMGVIVVFTNSANVTEITSENDKLEIEIGKGGTPDKYTESVLNNTQFKKDYPLPSPYNGNYTVKVTFLNSKVREQSKLARITELARDSNNASNSYVLVAVPPVAEAGPDQPAKWKPLVGATVHFDGRQSMTYEGARIINVTWSFGDGYAEEGLYEEALVVTYTYTMNPLGGTLKYEVTLTIVDSNGVDSSDKMSVTVSS